MATTSDRASGICPLSREQVIERYFLEHRAKLIDLAAFLDRVDRAAPEAANAQPDYRLQALHEALRIVADGQPQRARRVLELLSDPTDQPIASAAGMKGASGAHRPRQPRQEGAS